MADVPAPEPAAGSSSAGDVERRIVSVLFADLVGFTPLSERLDSEDVATIQDAYFSTARDTIARYGGVVEKFIGDAVMAVFGAPRTRDDDAERAVRAGLALIGSVEQLNARLGLERGSLQLRVGVNTGEVVHATSGADAGRVTGDTVNTAARLQAAARPGSALVGELTALSVADAIEMEAARELELKGKAEPVRVREATGVRAQPSRDEALGSLRAATLGREAELTRLHEAAGSVAAERCARRLVIIAPPGVGKSRLLAELAATTDVAVRRARVRPQATAPYETVAQLFDGVEASELEAALHNAGTTPSRAAVVTAEVGRLREPARAASAGGDLAAEREARFDAWLEALDALAERPVLWLIEDVHWAGPDLLAFLDRAGTAAARHGRLIVATARPSLLETASGWAGEDRMDLAPLRSGVAAELVRALVGDALPPALVEAVVDRSDGTPLFIEELIRTWISVGTLARDAPGGPWHLVVRPESVILPPTVQAIYAAQLDDLPPAARLVARRGSVAGRRVPSDAFGALGLGDRGDGLDILRRRAFLDGPLDDEITGAAYAYRHALLRDAGYASLARAERARLHVAMAAWLEQVAGDRADVVAEAIADHHASALESMSALVGGDLPPHQVLAARAASWYERAAHAALGLAAHESAARLLERAIALTAEDAVADAARRRLRLGTTLAEAANLDAGITHLVAARDGFTTLLPSSAPQFAEAAYALGQAYMQQIRFTETTDVTAGAIDALAASGADEPGGRARLLALHAWSVSAVAPEDGLIDEIREAEALAAFVNDPALQLDVLQLAHATRGEIGEAEVAGSQDIAERAIAIGRWPTAVTALRQEAADRWDVDPAAALPGIARSIELAEAHGMTEQRGWGELSRSETHFILGDWTAAIEAGLRALDVAEPRAYVRLAFRTWVVLLPMLAARRDGSLIERHDRWWPQALAFFPATPSAYGQTLIGAIGLWRALARGDAPPEPSAEIAAFAALQTHVNPHFRAALEDLVDAWLIHGRLDLAGAVADQPDEDDATRLMRASAALIRGRVARARGDDAAARTHALEVLQHAEPISARWWEARALRLLDEPAAAALERELGIRA